jgi:hypothetical protein
MPQPPFTARIRWQADADPSWEIETLHPGFETAEDAALFANGFLEAGAEELRLEGSRLLLSLADRTVQELSTDSIQVWRLPESAEDIRVADDADFQRVNVSLDQLSALGFDGGFMQIKYGVSDASGSQVVVVIETNEIGNLSVTVEEPRDDGTAGADASFALGIVARG